MSTVPSYTALILDDEIKPAEALKIKIREADPDVEITAVCRTSSDALEKILTDEPDILFLDIEMQDKNGLEFLGLLQNAGKQIQTIITTAHTHVEYLQQAIRYSTTDYLIKPIMKDELVEAINRAKKNINDTIGGNANNRTERHNIEKQYTFNCATGKILLTASQIVYIKAEGNYSRFYLNNGCTEVITEMMKSLEDSLKETSLIRVDRSHIINRAHVYKLTANSCICYFNPLTGVKPLNLSQRGVKALY